MSTAQPHPEPRHNVPVREYGSETKASYKTSELVIYVLMVIAMLIASAVADEASDFGTQEVWKYITFLTVGYLLSRGLAKSGTRASSDDDVERADTIRRRN